MRGRARACRARLPTSLALLEVLYIKWGWRLPVSNGDGAIAERAATNPELIVVTDAARSQLVVLEGHVRLTAYAAFPELLPDELELYLGSSPKIATWCQW